VIKEATKLADKQRGTPLSFTIIIKKHTPQSSISINMLQSTSFHQLLDASLSSKFNDCIIDAEAKKSYQPEEHYHTVARAEE